MAKIEAEIAAEVAVQQKCAVELHHLRCHLRRAELGKYWLYLIYIITFLLRIIISFCRGNYAKGGGGATTPSFLTF